MPERMFNITPNVYWELDFWGKVRRSNQAARAEIAASEEALRHGADWTYYGCCRWLFSADRLR